VVASNQRSFGARVARLFRSAGLQCERSDDVVGVQLAACAKNAAALAAAAALPAGFNAAGAAGGRVYEECWALAAARGAKPESFTGLSGAGDLLATVLASHGRNRRAGELLAQGATAEAIEASLGQAAESLDLVPLLAKAMEESGIRAPATAELASVIEGRRLGEAPEAEGLALAGVGS
jgi:glycerol-3-phosphate dehydrogenase